MTANTINTDDLLASLNNTMEEYLQLISSVNEKDLNTIPFENSWSAAQVTDHVARSINGMGEALNMPGKITDRQPDEKTNDLKSMFLNFESKMKSPLFILPEKEVYGKDVIIDKLKTASKKFIETGKKINPAELLDLSPLGQLTKLELLHFILYHTQRHTHQLKNILQKIHS